MTADVAYFVLRTSIGAIALWAGLSKLSNLAPLAWTVRAMSLGPARWSTAIARSILIAELVIAGSLLLDLAVPFGSALATTLFAVFAAAAWVALTTGRSAPCQCFGSSDGELASRLTVIRALGLSVASIALYSRTGNGIAPLPAGLVLPSLAISLALVVLVRFSSVLPQVRRYLTATPPTSLPGRVPRVGVTAWP